MIAVPELFTRLPYGTTTTTFPTALFPSMYSRAAPTCSNPNTRPTNPSVRHLPLSTFLTTASITRGACPVHPSPSPVA